LDNTLLSPARGQLTPLLLSVSNITAAEELRGVAMCSTVMTKCTAGNRDYDPEEA